MSKDDVAAYLGSLGYESSVVDGVVMVVVDHQLMPKEQKKLSKQLKDIGYNASYGYKVMA